MQGGFSVNFDFNRGPKTGPKHAGKDRMNYGKTECVCLSRTIFIVITVSDVYILCDDQFVFTTI
jgi:hypothetical protein